MRLPLYQQLVALRLVARMYDPASSAPALLPNLLHFGRVLRRLGLEVTSGRMGTLAEALAMVDLADRRQVKDAARAVLVSRREEIALFDRAFDLFFGSHRGAGPALEMGVIARRGREVSRRLLAEAPAGRAEGDEIEPREVLVERRFTASERERLRRKDFAELSASEAAAVAELIRRGSFTPPERRTRRLVVSRRGGRIDLRRTLRGGLRRGGEILRLVRVERRWKPRPLVVLCDVSGSMEPYARLLLQFLYTLRRGGARREVFAFGTRLTRLTRALAHRDADRALREAAAEVVDWGGGTRIGEALRRFNVDWSRRVLGQGAVVLLISDGWDRGEPEVLAREMARLSRSCTRLLWLNPLLGLPGYEPLTRGLVAALPFVDDFLPVHNLSSLEALGEVLALRGVGPAPWSARLRAPPAR